MPKPTKNSKARSRRNQIIPNQIYAVSVPQQTKVRMRYSELINITMSSGLAFDYLFNINSIFDPNRSGTGHQPQSRDQWATFYNRYRVDKMKFSLKPMGSSTTNIGHRVTVFPSNSTVGITAYDQAGEMPYSTTVNCNSTGTSRNITRVYHPHLVAGVTQEVYDADDRFQSDMAGSPNENLLLHVVFEAGDFGNPSIYFSVQMEFDVTLSDVLQLQVS